MSWSADVVPIVVMAAGVAWLVWRIVNGLRTGRILPFRSGPWVKAPFDRRTEPGQFWVTLAGHGVFLALVLGFLVLWTGLFDR